MHLRPTVGSHHIGSAGLKTEVVVKGHWWAKSFRTICGIDYPGGTWEWWCDNGGWWGVHLSLEILWGLASTVVWMMALDKLWLIWLDLIGSSNQIKQWEGIWYMELYAFVVLKMYLHFHGHIDEPGRMDDHDLEQLQNIPSGRDSLQDWYKHIQTVFLSPQSLPFGIFPTVILLMVTSHASTGAL